MSAKALLQLAADSRDVIRNPQKNKIALSAQRRLRLPFRALPYPDKRGMVGDFQPVAINSPIAAMLNLP
jgi:hypothetical protein